MSEEQLLIYVELVMMGALGDAGYGVNPFQIEAVQQFLAEAQAQYAGNAWVMAVVAAGDGADDLLYERVTDDDVYRAVAGLNAELGDDAQAMAFKYFLYDLAGTAGYAAFGDGIQPFMASLQSWLGI